MSNRGEIGIIIQARTGSTRLKNKMLLPFGSESTLIGYIINKVKSGTDIPVVLATSDSEKDKELGAIAGKLGVSVFYGSENDVLDRFTQAAKKYKFDSVVRVCADNPFLSSVHINELIAEFEKRSELDYLSYQRNNGTPVMKSHLGFFAEILTLEALLKAKEITQDPFYCEHVTNFIYGNKELFKVDFLSVPSQLDRDDYRLTLDTLEDYEMLFDLEKSLSEKHNTGYTLDDIMEMIFELDFSSKMTAIIKEQQK
ncbi:MAG: cytidylyltransferase domain-containing protein [Salibacteraceae bacterium]